MRQDEGKRIYLAIDLKSFYASVECVERGRNPLTTHLVVADAARSESTICLAVTPALKAYGVPSRPRLFEVVQQVRRLNEGRRRRVPNCQLTDETDDDTRLRIDPYCALGYIVAPPRMSLYLQYSAGINEIYQRFVSPEDMHIYSVDEVFIDVTLYVRGSTLAAKELALKMVQAVYDNTGITATVGIGTNLYLAKVAMDIEAKHSPPDEKGLRWAFLDEHRYRCLLWAHRPITDFWRIGRGYAKRLGSHSLYTMGDIARCSLGAADEYYNDRLLYKLFGINAELLIDHAWGWEPCTLQDIKAYRPERESISMGQVLPRPYTVEEGVIILREMAEELTLKAAHIGKVAGGLTIRVSYDTHSLDCDFDGMGYRGPVSIDSYGRQVPRAAQGSHRFMRPTRAISVVVDMAVMLYKAHVNSQLLIRKISITLTDIGDSNQPLPPESLDLFAMAEEAAPIPGVFNVEAAHIGPERLRGAGSDSYAALTSAGVLVTPQALAQLQIEREQRLQAALLAIRGRYGKNAILRGISLCKEATMKSRHGQIGGHKA